MRVTDNLRLRDMMRNLESVSSRHATAARQAATGLRVDSPSADPLGASMATRIGAALQQSETYRSNIGRALGDVELAEGALSESVNLLNRARELAMQGANGSLDAANRANLADEVSAIKEELIRLANVEGSYGSLFAGNRTETPAVDGSGVYQGDNGARHIEVGKGITVQVNLTGDEVFGGTSGGFDVFAELDQLETALRADAQDQVAASLDGMQGSLDQLNQARSKTGLILNRLMIANDSLELGEASLIQRKAEATEADAFESLSELTSLGHTLEQAVQVARTILGANLNRF